MPAGSNVHNQARQLDPWVQVPEPCDT